MTDMEALTVKLRELIEQGRRNAGKHSHVQEHSRFMGKNLRNQYC